MKKIWTVTAVERGTTPVVTATGSEKEAMDLSWDFREGFKDRGLDFTEATVYIQAHLVKGI